MNIRAFHAAIAAGAAAVAVSAPPASADGVNTGLAGFSVVSGSADLARFAGSCEYARSAAGIGGSGITYHVAGTGTAGGTYRGVPVVATGIRCRLILPSAVVVSGPEYLPGPAAETDTSYTTNDASGGPICTKVYAVLRQTPPGEADNLIESAEKCVYY